jgi:hypothetical protein
MGAFDRTPAQRERDAALRGNPDYIECWACYAMLTPDERLDADGNCPHCGSEIELEQEPAP